MQARFPFPIICPVVIGRMQEVTHFGTLVDQARSGTGQVAVVCGEAGIGKSRLVAEVKTEAVARDFLLMQGTCFPTDHAIPYAPLLDLLRSHFSSHSSALATPEVERGVQGVQGAHVAQAFLPLLPDVGYVLSGGASLPTLTPLDPAQEKRRRFETLIHFLAEEARVRPVLVVVEDLHWSDETRLRRCCRLSLPFRAQLT